MILVAVPAVALAVVSLAAFFGGTVWWLDVLANFRAQYVVALAVLGLVVMMSKWRKTAYFILAVAVVNLVAVLPLYIGSPAEARAGADSIRIMSFNLLSTNEEYSEVIDYIETVDPDVVFLHEASRPWEVAMESSGLDYEIVRPRSDDLIFGTLVLVRGDQLTAVSHGFAEAAPRAVSLEFLPWGWDVPLAVLATHPLAPSGEERADLRDAQLAFAGDWAMERSGAFLVVGDFNATPWSAPFRNLVATADLENSQRGFGLQPSFPTTSSLLLRVPIDHLVHSAALEVTDRQLGPALGSDHFPLVVDLQVVETG
ncbi:MAG TPA: endonuclease/exonuclease/phosphatase family protein [Acidimicrobiia bacterium]|nr:endonuclease/exonuclease/phosphatase family protein [Acidimicrobiia bacterium]